MPAELRAVEKPCGCAVCVAEAQIKPANDEVRHWMAQMNGARHTIESAVKQQTYAYEQYAKHFKRLEAAMRAVAIAGCPRNKRPWE